jgi:NADH-quinone oxidoreductase subunit J
VTWLSWFVAGVAVISATGVVLSRRTLYSALSLVSTVGMIAVLFLLLNAQFLFAVQIIVYAGAVMVLFIFIIALLNPAEEDRPRFDVHAIVGLLAAALMTVITTVLARSSVTPSGLLVGQVIGSGSDSQYNAYAFDPKTVDKIGNVQAVASQLFTVYVVPFEITSLILFVAAIGAVYLTKHHRAAERGVDVVH